MKKEDVRNGGVPGDAAMVRQIWPVLVAGALGLIPFTIFSTFLVGIADTANTDAATVGTLRGLGGVAALIVGIGCAPLIDKLSRRAISVGSLIVIGVACLAAAAGPLWTWIVFCLLIGAATATLNPALSAMAADSFDDEAASGRAATLVSSTMTLTSMLAAPLLAGPAIVWGWRGDLVATTVLCLLMALFLGRSRNRAGDSVPGADGEVSGLRGYLTSFGRVIRIPSVGLLLLISVLRTSAFMGQLAYIAVFYDRTYGLGPGVFSLVWTLSGLSFFLGNWFGGRFLRDVAEESSVVWVTVVASLVAVAGMVVLFESEHVVIALTMTATLAAAHAVIAACVTTLLVRKSGGQRGAVLALNGAGQSIGVFVGASLGGIGLASWGWPGIGAVLALTTALAACCGLIIEYSHRKRQRAARVSR